MIVLLYSSPIMKNDDNYTNENTGQIMLSNETGLVDTLNFPINTSNSTELTRVKRQGGGCGCGCGCCCCRPRCCCCKRCCCCTTCCTTRCCCCRPCCCCRGCGCGGGCGGGCGCGCGCGGGMGRKRRSLEALTHQHINKIASEKKNEVSFDDGSIKELSEEKNDVEISKNADEKNN